MKKRLIYPPPTDKQWEELVNYFKQNPKSSITTLSRKFKISLATVYRKISDLPEYAHRKKNCERHKNV